MNRKTQPDAAWLSRVVPVGQILQSKKVVNHVMWVMATSRWNCWVADLEPVRDGVFVPTGRPGSVHHVFVTSQGSHQVIRCAPHAK